MRERLRMIDDRLRPYDQRIESWRYAMRGGSQTPPFERSANCAAEGVPAL